MRYLHYFIIHCHIEIMHNVKSVKVQHAILALFYDTLSH
jgi:hypothetical protein